MLVLLAAQGAALGLADEPATVVRAAAGVLTSLLVLLHLRRQAGTRLRWAAALTDAGGVVLVLALPRWWPAVAPGPTGRPQLAGALALAALLAVLLALFVATHADPAGPGRGRLLPAGLVALVASSVAGMVTGEPPALWLLTILTGLAPVVLWAPLLRRGTSGRPPPVPGGEQPPDRPGAGRLGLLALLAGAAPASLLVGDAPLGPADVIPVVACCALLAACTSGRALLRARQLAAAVDARDDAVEHFRTLAEASRGLLSAGDLASRQRAVASGALLLVRDGVLGRAAVAVAVGPPDLLEVVAVAADGLSVEHAAGLNLDLLTELERTQLSAGHPVGRAIAAPDGSGAGREDGDSLLLIPLRAGERAVGALVLAAPAQTLARARPMLDVYALQASSALVGAAGADPSPGPRRATPAGTTQAITRGLRERQFLCHYQPIMDLTAGTVTGFEALVRWQHPERGLLLPGVFLPAVTEAGLLTSLDNSVLFQACAAAMRIDSSYGGPNVSVNLSAGQLMDEGFVELVRSALLHSALAPWRLQLEVTEAASLHRPELAATTLARLRAMRVRIAFDDFGTGYSSMSWLHQLPLDVVKIDKSFIDRLPIRPGNPPVVAAVTALSHVLGLGVVAEGVETTEQQAELLAMGVQSGQGWLWSRALPEADARRFLHEHTARPACAVPAARVPTA